MKLQYNGGDVMVKTKLGVSAGFIGFTAYILGGFSSLWVVMILMVYILATETDTNLRVNVVQATAMAAIFALIGFGLSGISSLVGIFDIVGYYRVDSVLRGIVNVVEVVVFLIAALSALKNNIMVIPFITGMVDKHFGEREI